jgi:2-oxoglutarate ferredoxin oxidoreductase subunit alpha
MYGTHAIGEAAILAGCRFYFGYPITPQNELPEYMSQRLPEVEGGVFLQAESEIAAINMVLGASAAGARAMTSSSSPGISLKQEGISYMAGQELPAVIINIMRGGPGLGHISFSQGDYFQSTRGGGHGDYRTIVLAPGSVQEMADMTYDAFDLADKYRNPVLVLGDGILGQMMEPVVLPKMKKKLPDKNDYMVCGAKDRQARVIKSFFVANKDLEDHNWKLYRKYQMIEKNEVRFETDSVSDARMVVIAYGTAARVAKGAINRLRKEDENIKIGIIRPTTLWPFPSKIIKDTSLSINDFFVFELSTGQMLDDVRIALEGSGHIHFYGRPGSVVPAPSELARVMARHYYQLQKAKRK